MNPFDFQEQDIEPLVQVGLTSNEAKVYLSLIELGQANVQEIAKISGIHRVSVYDNLKKLIKEGIVNSSVVDGKKYFQPADPTVFLNILQEKMNEVSKVIPKLESIKKAREMETQVGLYEGKKALYNIFNNFLENKSERVVYGVPKEASIHFHQFLDSYHQRRIHNKKKLRHIYNSDARKRVKVLRQQAYTKTRFLPPELDSPVATSICGDQVVLTLWDKRPICIALTNAKIANAYRNYFEFLWEKAKE